MNRHAVWAALIRELRLCKAQWLLQQQRVNTLQELAYEVGFKSPAYFRRLYNEFFDRDLSAHFTKTALTITPPTS